MFGCEESKGKGKDRCTNCGAYTCDRSKDQCVCDKCMAYIDSLGYQFNGYGRPPYKYTKI